MKREIRSAWRVGINVHENRQNHAPPTLISTRGLSNVISGLVLSLVGLEAILDCVKITSR